MKKTDASQYKSLSEHVNTLVSITDYIVDKLEKDSVKESAPRDTFRTLMRLSNGWSRRKTRSNAPKWKCKTYRKGDKNEKLNLTNQV